MRACVYTAIFGGYDTLSQPPRQTVPCDFVCFTDAVLPARVGAWQIVRSNLLSDLHPRIRAKFFKCMNHEVFPGGRMAWRFAPWKLRRKYDYTIWIDGCIRIKTENFVEEYLSYVGTCGLAMFIHPDRNCIFEEVKASVGMLKYAGLPLHEQVDRYRQEGYPAHAGLIAAGLIARRAGHPTHPTINAAWWTENLKWTYQDQLSLPVVLWRLGLGYDQVQLNLWDNTWFDWLGHNSDL